VQKLSHHNSHRERRRCTVGYSGEQLGSLLQINMTSIL
jgi:hypothetical protein